MRLRLIIASRAAKASISAGQHHLRTQAAGRGDIDRDVAGRRPSFDRCIATGKGRAAHQAAVLGHAGDVDAGETALRELERLRERCLGHASRVETLGADEIDEELLTNQLGIAAISGDATPILLHNACRTTDIFLLGGA